MSCAGRAPGRCAGIDMNVKIMEPLPGNRIEDLFATLKKYGEPFYLGSTDPLEVGQTFRVGNQNFCVVRVTTREVVAATGRADAHNPAAKFFYEVATD